MTADTSATPDEDLAPGSAGADAPEPPRLLTEPGGGIPFVTNSRQELERCARLLRAGSGPVAVDAERASGFRYGQRAFLVQIKREGAGIWLIDPEAFEDLGIIQDALGGVEWILHASTQDLPCLSELGLWPDRLFDTELAGRLLGLPRVGLASVLEQLLGVTLAKEHSAADWSTRPLPEDWLRYAALDVELLVELRAAMIEMLADAGKLDWAEEEFEAIRTAPLPGPRKDPWRRTSGMHRLRKPQQLAVVRELWETREALARNRDVAPGRLIPDAAIVAAAASQPSTVPALLKTPGFHGRAAAKEGPRWVRAIQAGQAAARSREGLPQLHLPLDGPPPPRAWRDRNPLADRRLKTAKAWIGNKAEELSLPTENLLTPDTLRRLCWAPPERIDPDSVADALTALGARGWQVSIVAPILTVALLDPDPA
ncbi:HRDC domain-containing protein [Citricoccus sp. I39-566]|uniref:HRDC domain-containing protein n=1 Tax=Citricoccus sp. I39-566 TaxID=3073268 RepID=UPI0037BEC5DB